MERAMRPSYGSQLLHIRQRGCNAAAAQRSDLLIITVSETVAELDERIVRGHVRSMSGVVSVHAGTKLIETEPVEVRLDRLQRRIAAVDRPVARHRNDELGLACRDTPSSDDDRRTRLIV